MSITYVVWEEFDDERGYTVHRRGKRLSITIDNTISSYKYKTVEDAQSAYDKCKQSTEYIHILNEAFGQAKRKHSHG